MRILKKSTRKLSRPSGSTADMHAVQHGRFCASMQNACFYVQEDEDVHCWPPIEWVQRYHARGGRVETPLWKLKRQFSGRRKAAKMFNEFVVTATDRNRAMSRAATTLQTTRNNVDLRVSPKRFLRVWEQCGIGMAPREFGCTSI